MEIIQRAPRDHRAEAADRPNSGPRQQQQQPSSSVFNGPPSSEQDEKKDTNVNANTKDDNLSGLDRAFTSM